MRVESQTLINAPAQDVFEYIAHAEYLPEYVSDFDSVSQVSEGEPGLGTQYRYKMKRGAEGTFEWTRFEPSTRLQWEGPAVTAGPGTMQPAGWWEITQAGSGTDVKLVMSPTPGGLFKLLAPFMAAGMRKGNERALTRLKDRLERSGGGPAGEGGGPGGPAGEGAGGPAGEGGGPGGPAGEGGGTPA